MPGRLPGWATGLPVALLLAGCAQVPSAINPVSWWHSLQGGAIAEQRPPPPGASDPYPNLATVPPAPPQPNRAALNQITDALVADRANAQHEAAAAPLADPSSPTASPALFGTGTAPPPGPPTPAAKPGTSGPAAGTGTAATAAGTSAPAAAGPSAPPVASASMPAAPAPAPPPAPARPPAKAPVASVNSAPLAPPGSTPADTVPPPQIPAAPPPAPSVPGFAIPTAGSAAPAAPVPASIAGNTVTVPFASGSARLPPSAASPLKQLAAKRGSGSIAVTGYGDATSATPDAQSTALTLGFARAQAMAAVLTASGVPPGAVQIDAQAIGRGGSASLVQ